ncbi:MAG TPA: hypothetical protein VGG20_01285 [Thermoanaerobaculia bacterium]|jgi:hypothetical protein
MSVPLSKEEGFDPNLMDRRALETPGIIAREAVARLNSGGGVIRIGLWDGARPAMDAPEAAWEGRTLANYLADTIEPSPARGELLVEAQGNRESLALRLTLRPEGKRGPYAFLEGGGRHFLVRHGGHTRWMHRGEIFGDTCEDLTQDRAAVQALLTEEKERQEEVQRDGGDLWWLRLQPARSLDLDLAAIEESDLLIDPRASGNRPAGFVAFAALAGFSPRVVRDTSGKASLDVGRKENTFLRIFEDGGISFTAPLIDFWWPSRRPDDPQRMFFPDAILEYPISVFRLAAQIYRRSPLWAGEGPDETDLVVHMAVFNCKGWSLRPGSPRRWTFRPPEAVTFTKGDDFVLEKPLVFPLREMENPDVCGVRLLQRFYEAFGFSRAQMPAEIDRKTGLLNLP